MRKPFSKLYCKRLGVSSNDHLIIGCYDHWEGYPVVSIPYCSAGGRGYGKPDDLRRFARAVLKAADWLEWKEARIKANKKKAV